ncbi:MAG: hypothetical protein ABMA64_06875 [Myxococcota bacterium]
MSDDTREFHTRLDGGWLRWVVALLWVGAWVGLWYWGRQQVPWADRVMIAASPVGLALAGLIVSFRRELHAGPYGIVITTWPIPLFEQRMARPDVLVVAVAKRPRRRRVWWDVVAQTRSHGYRKLTRPFADNDGAEAAATAIRAALDRPVS